MRRIGVICLMLMGILLGNAAHKYYHSFTSLEVNTSTHALEIVSELFWHDVEQGLSETHKKKIAISDPKIDDLLLAYYNDHFKLSAPKGEALKLKMVGSELKRDQIIVYLEAEAVSSLDGYTLENTLLISTFSEQVNQVSVKDQAVHKSLLFSASQSSKVIHYK